MALNRRSSEKTGLAELAARWPSKPPTWRHRGPIRCPRSPRVSSGRDASCAVQGLAFRGPRLRMRAGMLCCWQRARRPLPSIRFNGLPPANL